MSSKESSSSSGPIRLLTDARFKRLQSLHERIHSLDTDISERRYKKERNHVKKEWQGIFGRVLSNDLADVYIKKVSKLNIKQSNMPVKQKRSRAQRAAARRRAAATRKARRSRRSRTASSGKSVKGKSGRKSGGATRRVRRSRKQAASKRKGGMLSWFPSSVPASVVNSTSAMVSGADASMDGMIMGAANPANASGIQSIEAPSLAGTDVGSFFSSFPGNYMTYHDGADFPSVGGDAM